MVHSSFKKSQYDPRSVDETPFLTHVACALFCHSTKLSFWKSWECHTFQYLEALTLFIEWISDLCIENSLSSESFRNDLPWSLNSVTENSFFLKHTIPFCTWTILSIYQAMHFLGFDNDLILHKSCFSSLVCCLCGLIAVVMELTASSRALYAIKGLIICLIWVGTNAENDHVLFLFVAGKIVFCMKPMSIN